MFLMKKNCPLTKVAMEKRKRQIFSCLSHGKREEKFYQKNES